MPKLISLNIEGDKHFDRVIPFLKKEDPDVICLQEVFAQDLPMIEKELGMKSIYAPMVCYLKDNQYVIAPRGVWGMVTLTKLDVVSHQIRYYKGDKKRIPVFRDGQPNSANRGFIVTELAKGDQKYKVINTHFTWSAKGEVSEEQIQDSQVFLQMMDDYSDFVLCGDFNAVRGLEDSLFQILSQRYTDNVPTDVTTTIDPDFHYAGDIQVVVDGMFSSGSHRVNEVKIVGKVSDHKAVVGEVEIKQ